MTFGWTGEKKKWAEQALCRELGDGIAKQINFQKLADSDDAEDIAKARAISNLVRFPERRPGNWKPMDFIKPDLNIEERTALGNWALSSALTLDMFYNTTAFPELRPGWNEAFNAMLQGRMRKNPHLLPSKSSPVEWNGWLIYRDDGPPQTFIRNRSEGKGAIAAAFDAPMQVLVEGKNGAPIDTSVEYTTRRPSEWREVHTRVGFEHAAGINNMRRVLMRINTKLLPFVERFARDVVAPSVYWNEETKRFSRSFTEAMATNLRIGRDIETAKYLSDGPFWFDYSVDTRGRAYPTTTFSFLREDYVRSLILFDKGAPLGADGMKWLKIHLANCGAFKGKDGARIDRSKFADRVEWVDDNIARIRAIAEDPAGTFMQEGEEICWGTARGGPFQFLAACFELVEAENNPGFVSRLPVCFDCTTSAIQHLALLARDADVARRVNLTHSDKPQDICRDIAEKVRNKLRRDTDPWGRIWHRIFEKLDDGEIRGLIKLPVTTMLYGSMPGGRRDQILESFSDQKLYARLDEEDIAIIARNIRAEEKKKGKKAKPNKQKNDKRIPMRSAAEYLAKIVHTAAEDTLGKSLVDVRNCIREIAKHRRKRREGDDAFLRWMLPSGLLVLCIKKKRNLKTIRVWRNLSYVRYDVGDGWKGPDHAKASRAHVADFVHSLDAAHLIAVANAAAALSF